MYSPVLHSLILTAPTAPFERIPWLLIDPLRQIGSTSQRTAHRAPEVSIPGVSPQWAVVVKHTHHKARPVGPGKFSVQGWRGRRAGLSFSWPSCCFRETLSLTVLGRRAGSLRSSFPGFYNAQILIIGCAQAYKTPSTSGPYNHPSLAETGDPAIRAREQAEMENMLLDKPVGVSGFSMPDTSFIITPVDMNR
ncbi:hypothetical protein Bbelb_429000 [Branchiostoma belcheri]|nr:hypothetical protein Bbelb_429000 [Branchiostoma belcheri]